MKKTILLILYALLNVLSAHAYDFKVGGIYYNRISDTSVEITFPERSIDKYSESVVIPATVEYGGNSYRVLSIGYRAFSDCTLLRSVTIPEGMTSIRYEAFKNCFGLTSVSIPESIETVGDKAFYNCVRTRGPLYNSKIFVYIPQDYSGEYVIPSGIQSIAGGAFCECSDLTSVTIPESVEFIGNEAFKYCRGLTSVTIPESVTSIGGSAFKGCTGLTSVTIPESVTSIGGSAFEECTGLTSVTIPESVTSIAWYAFRGCSSLTSVTIPESVTSIGVGVFDACTQLKRMEWNAVNCRIDNADVFSRENNITTIIFGNQVVCIPSYLCYGWDKLTSVTIPESVDTIGDYVFRGCISISSPLYNSKIFAYVPQDYSGEYVIPSGIQSIAGGAFCECTGLTSLTIPESVTSIGAYAFEKCTGLTSVAIPESVTSIAWYAFRGCSSLTSVTIPERVTSIGFAAFKACTGLSSLTIPESVTTIEAHTFEECTGLTSVTIPESVTSIGESAFEYCRGLTSLIIPKSVTSIGAGAFKYCWGLTSLISLSENPPYCERDAFSGCQYATLLVPCGCKEAYQLAEEWKEFSTIKEMATVTVRPNDASMGSVTGGGEFEEGERALLAATPNTGYHFEKWDDENTENPRTLTVTRDIVLTAIFAANESSNTYRVMVRSNDATMGAVTGGGEFKEGERALLAATSNAGYHFVKWDDENTENPRTLTVIRDTVLTAIFAKVGGGNTAVEVPDALQAVRVYADGGRIEVRGLPLGTAVTLSGVDGRLWYQTEAATDPELSLVTPRGHVYVLRLNHTHSLKVYLP